MPDSLADMLRDACEVDRILLTEAADPAAVLLADLSSRPDVADLVRMASGQGLQATVDWMIVALEDGRRVARCDVAVTAPTSCEFALVTLLEAEVAEALATGERAWLVDAARASADEHGIRGVDGEPLHPLTLPVEGPPWADIARRIRAGR